MKWVGWIYGALVTSLMVRFAVHTPKILTPTVQPFEVPRRGFVMNLASLSAGARVEVSDYDVYHHHHPLYAIDEEPNPSIEEKWASLSHRDGTAAWLDVILAASAEVRLVRLALAGSPEGAELNARDFDLVCLRRDAETRRIRVRGNLDPKPKVLLDCPATTRVRIEFPPAPPPLDRARLYEIEVWGSVE
jgi:hypothetical protein